MGFKDALRTLLNLRRDQREREQDLVTDTLLAQWEEDTCYGAFPDRESRDAWLAKHADWRESFTGSIDEFIERDFA